MESLKDIREEINQVDKEMAKLFEKRMKAVEKIAEAKKQSGIT